MQFYIASASISLVGQTLEDEAQDSHFPATQGGTLPIFRGADSGSTAARSSSRDDGAQFRDGCSLYVENQASEAQFSPLPLCSRQESPQFHPNAPTRTVVAAATARSGYLTSSPACRNSRCRGRPVARHCMEIRMGRSQIGRLKTTCAVRWRFQHPRTLSASHSKKSGTIRLGK